MLLTRSVGDDDRRSVILLRLLHSFDELWWMWDTIKELDNKRYLLKIEIEPGSGPRKIFTVEFEIPEIERE